MLLQLAPAVANCVGEYDEKFVALHYAMPRRVLCRITDCILLSCWSRFDRHYLVHRFSSGIRQFLLTLVLIDVVVG